MHDIIDHIPAIVTFGVLAYLEIGIGVGWLLLWMVGYYVAEVL